VLEQKPAEVSANKICMACRAMTALVIRVLLSGSLDFLAFALLKSANTANIQTLWKPRRESICPCSLKRDYWRDGFWLTANPDKPSQDAIAVQAS